jgi:hypothetical protein
MHTILVLAQMVLIIGGLLLAVGALFYALCWAAISLVQFFPLVGRRHRHPKWEEMHQRSARK